MATGVEHCSTCCDLGFHCRDVFLATETWVDGHDQHHLDQVENVFDRRQWGSGVQRNRGIAAEIGNVGERAVQVSTGFGVHDEKVTTCVDVLLGHEVGVVDHEVSFEAHIGIGTTCRYHVGTKRQVGNVVGVHDIPLNAIGAGFAEPTTFFAKVGKIGGQN